MDEIARVPDHMLHRLPGLFRRWELAQVIEAGKHYHIEHAGSACDGTTLYAVYVGPAVASETEIEQDAEVPSRPGQYYGAPVGGDACLALRLRGPGPVSDD